MKDGSNKEQEIQPMMILTIDIGNGHVDKLQLFDLNNIEQETYDFCVKNKLDFNTMQEINTQIQNVLKDKQLEEEQEIDNEFQEIKEEEDEKITENNINEIREQESIIITNSNEIDTQKGNKSDINKIKEYNMNINKNEINKKENENMNSINSNGNTNGINIKKNNNQSIRTNSTISNGKENKKIKKTNKIKKRNIKENIKEAIAMAKEKTKQNKQSNKENNQDINNHFYKKIINNKKEKNGFEENINKKEEYNQEYNNIDDNINNNIAMNIDNNENNNEENKNENIEINVDEGEVEGKRKKEKNINNNDINQIQSGNLNNSDKKEEETSPIKNNINKENTNTSKEGIEKDNEVNNNKDNSNDKINNNICNNISNKISNNIIIKEENNNSKENQINKKKNKSNNESDISGYNPGRELYERGIKFKESEKEKLEALKKNLEVDDEEDNTFTPKINKLSDVQIERIREKRLECTNPDIINNYKEYKQAKMELLKKRTDEEFNKIYTFKPCINRSYSTTKIQKNSLNEQYNNMNNMNNYDKTGTRFDKLYNYRIDYKENKDKLKEKIYNKYSFKPHINENSSFYKLKIPFNERLQTYSNKSKENMAKIQQVYERELGYDEPFKPQLNHKKNKTLLKDRDEFFINEAQKYNTNNNNIRSNNKYIDPYTKLYLYGKKYQQDKNYMAEKFYQNQIKPPQFCQSTEDIINKKKEKSFKQIFKLLDGDEDSKISSTHINISKLPKNILKILEPILNELKEENETLNEIEFIFVCEQLYLSLPWNERRELTTFEDLAKKNLKKEKIIKEKNNFSFKPKINKRNYSFDIQTILTNTNNNNDLNSNINYNEIFNKNNNNSIVNSYKNYSNYYINRKIKEKSNEKNKEKKIKNGKNQINNRINYFNVRLSNKNSGDNIIKNNNNNENIHININNNKNNINKDKYKYSILKNVNINIIGNNSNNNKDGKKTKIAEKKINYENFVNI